MGKIIVSEYDLHDQNNILLPGQTLVAYPLGLYYTELQRQSLEVWGIMFSLLTLL